MRKILYYSYYLAIYFLVDIEFTYYIIYCIFTVLG